MTNSFDRKVVQSVVGNTPKANVIREETPLLPLDEKEEKEIFRQIKVHVASKNWSIMEDGNIKSPYGTDLNIVGKTSGVGVTIRNNGDIMFQAGSQAGGKLCGGRILINAKGGQLIKSGPSIQEYVSSGKSSVEGEGAENDKDQIAHSVIAYGDVVEEVHGSKHIRGRHITIDAGDVLTLMAKEKVVIQAGPTGGGEIVMNAGKITQVTDISDRLIRSQDMTVASEKTTMQFDPRATDNLITPGHLNIKTLGDLSVQAGGVARVKVLGLANGLMLVRDSRLSALNVHCVRGNLSMLTNIGSVMVSAGNGPSWPTIDGVGSFTVKAKTNIKQEALLNYEAKATAGKMDLEALGVATLKAIGGLTLEGTGDVDLKSSGVVRVTGTLIKLN